MDCDEELVIECGRMIILQSIFYLYLKFHTICDAFAGPVGGHIVVCAFQNLRCVLDLLMMHGLDWW